MSTPTDPALLGSGPITQTATGGATEASLLPRLVAILTPFFAIAAGWVASWVADHTGVQLDKTQVAAFMVTVATTALVASWKWLTGWQQHELLVAQGRDVPRKPGPRAPAPPSP